jgi:hypothetical protein
MTYRLRHRSIRKVEVRLVLFVELFAFALFKIIPTLDQNSALIGAGLAFVELMPRPGRGRCWSFRSF